MFDTIRIERFRQYEGRYVVVGYWKPGMPADSSLHTQGILHLVPDADGVFHVVIRTETDGDIYTLHEQRDLWFRINEVRSIIASAEVWKNDEHNIR